MNDEAQDRLVTQALRQLADEPHCTSAWRTLYRALSPTALAQAFRLLGGDRAAAEDACQEAFARLLRLGPGHRFNLAADLRKYFSKMVRSACIDRLRRCARDLHARDFDSLEGEELDALRDGTAVLYIATATADELAEQRQALAQLLTQASPAESKLLTLLAEGYTTLEIGEMLDISPQTAAVRVFRLRKKLRSSLSVPPIPGARQKA